MFCPRCSHQQPSDDTRFCARCGMALTEVCEAVERADAQVQGAKSRGEWSLPPQRYMGTGAAMMFAGAAAAVLWGMMATRTPAEASLLPQAYFIIGGTLAFLLTLFHPLLRSLERLFSGEAATSARASRRDGINLGALLMFVGVLKAALLTSLMPPGPERGLTTLAFMAGMLVLILLLRPVLRAVHSLFFKNAARAEESASDTARLDSKERASALPPARDFPVNGFKPARADTADLVPRPSVTEDTTRKLSDI